MKILTIKLSSNAEICLNVFYKNTVFFIFHFQNDVLKLYKHV